MGGTEVCASTATGDLTPYESEYEGYMGNWGNTLDRWYHRAAVVVWPREQAFANRAETSPAWALDEIAAMASAGDVAGARAAAATLGAVLGDAVRGWTRRRSGGSPRALGQGTAGGGRRGRRGDRRDAAGPFRIENLTSAHAEPLARSPTDYGQHWTADLLRTWFGDGPAGLGVRRGTGAAAVGGGPAARPVRRHCTRRAAGRHGPAAQRLLDLAWEWLSKEIRSGLASSSPSRRDGQLGELGKPLAALLTAAAAHRSREHPGRGFRIYPASRTTRWPYLEMSALRAARHVAAKADARRQPASRDLAADCAARLRARLARPQRATGDWSVELPAGGCTCELCATLATFLADPGGEPSSGRSPRSAGSTSTPGSTPPNCLSRT